MREWFAGLALAALIAGGAAAQDTKVGIGISGWTGFAPLTLAKEAGIFKNGLDVTIKKIRRRAATWRSSRATSNARPRRSRPGWCGTPTASPRSRSSSSTRATAPTVWW